MTHPCLALGSGSGFVRNAAMRLRSTAFGFRREPVVEKWRAIGPLATTEAGSMVQARAALSLSPLPGLFPLALAQPAAFSRQKHTLA